jgi:endogenous inhibitor of DNA gyrase (YacG/DUF329 family)
MALQKGGKFVSVGAGWGCQTEEDRRQCAHRCRNISVGESAAREYDVDVLDKSSIPFDKAQYARGR